MTIEKIVRDRDDRRFALLRVVDIDDLRDELREIGEPFVLFLALDATLLAGEAIDSLAVTADEAGITYLCAWGPNCRRVEDGFDVAIVNRRLETDSDRFVMTTSHANDNLEDAVWFFAEVAWPAEPERSDLWLAASVGNDAWAERIASQIKSGELPPD
jgi:hypothetical protein